jgi:hypothetical protein
MLIQTRAISFAIATALLAAACSDDDAGTVNGTDGSTEAGTGGDATTGNPDGGQDIDATLGGDADIDGAMVAPDGNILNPVGDASVSGDAGEGGAVGLDASSDARVVVDATSPDGGPCEVTSAQFGCGTVINSDWVSFPGGVQVDRVNKVAWTAPVSVVDDDALAAICQTLDVGGLTGWNIPQMQDVRKLAGGCAETVPGGSCQVNVDNIDRPEAGDCTCDTGLTGPNNGKFCRADVPTCETIWVWTHTWEMPDAGDEYEHWFYDVNTGSIVPSMVGVGIALEAKGRCMHPLSDAQI